MTAHEKQAAAQLSAALIAADRESKPVNEEPLPTGHLMSPIALLLYPSLRRHRKLLLPYVLAGTVAVYLLVAFLR